jgi:hypothetical protein
MTPIGGFVPSNKRNYAFTGSKTMRHGDEKKLSMQDELKSSDELINFLENKLE